MSDEAALILIMQELRSSRFKHPVWPNNEEQGYLILAEEFGEAAQALVDFRHKRLPDDSKYVREIIQTAAMCIRILTQE